MTRAGDPRAPEPRLMVVTDLSVAERDEMERRIDALCAGALPRTVVVQVRDREQPARQRLELARSLARMTAAHGQSLIVNDRCDIAMLCGAAGVHLGEGGVATAEARRLLGEGAFVSRARHDPTRLDLEADAVVLSPIIEPRKGNPALGLNALSAARARLESSPRSVLLYALGGVTAETARACLEAGADGVAVVGAALGARDPARILTALGIARG